MMNTEKIEKLGKERDASLFKGIMNTLLIMLVFAVLLILLTTTMAQASSTVAYDATRINSQNGTNFNGSQYLRSLSVPINQTNGFTVIVFASQVLNTTQATIFKYDTSNTDITGYISFGPTNGDWGLRMACNNCTDTLSSGTSSLPNLSTMYMMTFQYNGSHFLTYRNNVLEFSDDTNLTGATETGNIYIGALENGGTTARGNISKVLIYNRTLSALEIYQENTIGANTLTNNTYGLTAAWLLNQTLSLNQFSNSSNVFDLSYNNNNVIRNYLLKEDFEGSSLNSSIWTVGSPYNMTGSCTPSNSGELQNYDIISPNDVVNVSNGVLTLLAKNESNTCSGVTKNYTAGAINSRGKFGWFANSSEVVTIEFKFKMNLTNNSASAIFPAFWTTTTNSTLYVWPPEIDWLELKGENCFINGNIFNASGSSQSMNSGCFDYLNNWVTLKIKYNNDAILGYANDILVYNYTNQAFIDYNVGYLPSILRINFALYPRNGTNPRDDLMPYRYLIDYVYVYTETNTLYVNVSHPSCSDSYSRSQAINPSTPWCDISAAESYAQSGDTVVVADGTYRDFDTYNFNANWNSTVTLQAQSNNTIITGSQTSSCEVAGNTCWTNSSNSTNTNMWTRSITTGSTTVGVTYINTSQPILRCSANNLSISITNRGFECTYFTSNTLYLDLEAGKNPNNIPFYIWKGDTISLDSVTNVAFKGFTIVGGEQLVTVGSGYPTNITFENNRILGGYSDTGAVDIRRVIGLNFINNTIYRTQLSSWWWFMIKQSNLGGETAGFYCEGACNNMQIINNTISNYYNGIVVFNTTAPGNVQNIRVSNNNITNIVDDGIEFEGYGNNVTIFNNTIYDTYVAVSLTPFNSTGIATLIEYNQIHAVKRINYSKSGSTYTSRQNGAFKLLENSSLVNAVINHNSIYGERVIACYAGSQEVYWNCMNNVNITNNLMLSENNYVLDGSGLNSSKVYYNNNLYFNASGGSNIFRYWNSGSSTSYLTLAAAKASANNPGTWDTASLNVAPLVANFLTGNFTPDGNSPLNGSASDGTYIGAVAPSAFIYNIVNVTITSANNTNLTGVSILQVNYTVGGSEPTYCDVYLDGIYHTNQSTPTAGDYSSIITNTNVGTHTYYITCYDESLSTATSGVYSFFYEKALINGTRSSYVGSETNCVGSNCGAGNSNLAFDGNLTTKANYVVGSGQYINNLYSNYTNPNGMLSGNLHYSLYCEANYSGMVSLTTNMYSSGKVQLQGYVVAAGFKSNYLSVYNGTGYQLIGSLNPPLQDYVCGISGGSAVIGYYETYINYTLNYAVNFSNTNNSYTLRNQNTNLIASLLNPGSLGSSITYNLKVYNSTNSIIYSTTFNSTQNNISVPVNFTTNGIYTYNVTAENTTHYAISELYTINVYDFTTTFTSPVNNENFNNTLLINWTNTFAGGSSYNITGTNITIDGNLIANLVGNSSTYLWNNTYNYNLSLGTHTIAVNVYDSSGTMTNTTTTANHTYNTRINITAKTAIGGSSINTYSGWVYESSTGTNVSYSTTTGQALVDFLRGNITVFIDATNYSIANTTNYASFNLTTAFYDQTFYLYETNALNVTFYDEANPSVLLSGVSINLELISDLYSGSYNTTNGTMYLPLLTAETYTLRYTAPRYTTRFYTVTITNDTFQNIQLYLLNSTISNNISIYIVNQVLNPVEGAIVKALKYNLPTNSYILQEIGTTDVNGRVIMTLTMNDEYYKFIVEYPSGEVKTITDPAYISSTTQTIGIDFTRDLTEEYQNYKSITYDLSFNTLSNNFRLDYTDTNNLASQYCLYVYKVNNATQELYGVDCETGSSGTILVPVENATGTVYEAKAVYTENGVQKFLTSLIQEFPWINALANQFGIFLQILISLAFASLFILNAGIAIIGLGFSLILGKLLGITIFGWGGLVAIQIVCLIIGIILAMKK